MINGWIDFNIDGDWDDASEQVFVDQALSNGVNNLTVTIPAGAATGSTFARFRITTTAGYSYLGLASDGEVEDYQVTIVAAKDSAGRLGRAASFKFWVAASPKPSNSPTAVRTGPYESVEPSWTGIVDSTIAEMTEVEGRLHWAASDLLEPAEDLVDLLVDGVAAGELLGSPDMI